MNVTGEGCGFSSSLDDGLSYVDRGYLEYRQYEAWPRRFFAQMFTFRYGLFELSLPDLVAVHESTPAK